ALRMGDWSYAIYLWHWPLIIVATYQIEPFTWPYKLGVIALTFLLSAASQRLIEDPLRHAKPFKIPKRAFTLMASNMAIIAALTSLPSAPSQRLSEDPPRHAKPFKIPTRAFTLMASNMATIAALTFFIPQLLAPNTNQEVTIEECTGANALLNNCDNKGLEGQPDIPPTQVADQKTNQAYPECFIPAGKTDFDRSDCSLGADPDEADVTIAVFGSSHARMWLPLFDEVGKQNNWNIQGYTK